MFVRNLTQEDKGRVIRVIAIHSPNTVPHVITGKQGTLTDGFGEYSIEDFGIFLDVPISGIDTWNLEPQDEIEFVE